MLHKVIGPRGGISTADVSCYTCLCGTSCNLTKAKELGCGDWVNEAGQRVFLGTDAIDLPTDPAGKDCTGCGKCEDVLEPPPVKLPENMEELAPVQRELNKLMDARIENLKLIPGASTILNLTKKEKEES